MVSPGPLAEDLRSANWRDMPGHNDVMVAQLVEVIGGPVGHHALVGRTRWVTPVRVVLLLAVVFLALGWSSKAGCIQQAPMGPNGELGLDWSDSRQYVALCYSDTVPLYGAERLDAGEFPYKSSWVETTGSGSPQIRYDGSVQRRYMEYPVLTGLYQYVGMTIAKAWYQGSLKGWLPGALQVVIFFNVIALGLSLAWLVTIWASAQLAGRRVWDSALIAASPIVIFQIFTNFDALATAFASSALLAWSRKKPLLAGVLLGLGAAAKLYPALLLGPLLVLCLRTGKMRQWLSAAAATAVTWTVVNLPIAVLFPAGWREFLRLNTERGMDPDSVYNVVASFTGWKGFDGHLGLGEPPSMLNSISFSLFMLACLGIGYIALTAARRPRLMQLAFLVIAAFLLTNKVWSPQFSLWLVPLAVLALPHRRILLAWMTIDALVWVPRMYYLLGENNKGLPEQVFTGTVVLRDLAVLGLCTLVIWQIYRPENDIVRYGWVDDPAGGVLDQAADLPPTWLPQWLRPRQAQVVQIPMVKS
ncbi:MAG: glycosyltransferase family 87 protein [Mycobacteriaceae bacterium]